MEIIFAGDRRRAALDKIRGERTAALAEIESVSEGQLSLDETVARVLAGLGKQADSAQFRVLAFAHPSVNPSPPAIDAGFLLWLFGADFEKQLRARLKPLVPATAMSQSERSRKVASLRARVAELERREEAEICLLEAQELVVDRRADVDVEMLLRVWDELDASAVQP